MLTFHVPGRPAAQGSKRHVGNGRFIEASKYLPAWRQAVTAQAQAIVNASDWQPADGPIQLHVDFFLARPKSVPVTKRAFRTKAPDIDKLVRAVCDALTDAEVWLDDSQVVKLISTKNYADDVDPGCIIQVTRLTEYDEHVGGNQLL